MESGGPSGGGGGDGGACSGGHLCHLCGYKYPSAHPSAKQRRAHRKNCGGKSPSTAAAAAAVAEEEGGSGERDGKKFLLGEGEGEAGGGEGSGAGASDYGGGFPRSAQDVGNAVEDEDNAEHSSPNGAGVQVIINRSTEDCIISRNNIPSEIVPKANETDNQTEVATQLSENAPYLEDSYPSHPAITCDQHQDASASHCPSEPEDSEFAADEINKSIVMSLASNAAAGDISAQTNAVVGCPDDIAVTEVDCMINTIGKDKTSDDVLAKGSEIDSSYQDKLQTKIVEGHSATTVEEDPSVDNFTAVSKEEIPDEEIESKEQSGLILASSIEQVSTIKEPVNLLGNEESCTEKHVCTDDTNDDDLFELASGGCHLEAVDIAKPQQQTDSTSVAADQLTISKQTDSEEGHHCPDADMVIQAVSRATGPAVDGETKSSGSAANLTEKDCSSEVTLGDGIQDNASHTSVTFMPSQVDIAELSSYPTSYDINMVSSIEGVEEKRQNENISADLTSHEINEMSSIDVEEKPQSEENTAYATSHATKSVCSTGNFGENKQNEEIFPEASSHNVSIVQSTGSIQENEQIEEIIASPDSDKINVISSRDNVEEKKQNEVYVETFGIENVEGKKQNEEITAHTTCEISALNIPKNVELKNHNEETARDPTACEINVANVTDNVDEKKQNEEITTDPIPHAIDLICSPNYEDKKQNGDMIEASSSHEIIVANGIDNAKEKNEEIMPDPTSYKIDAVSTTKGVEEKKQIEVTVDPTSHGINVAHTIDNVKEKKNDEPASDPTSCKISAESNRDYVEEKMRNEEIAVNSSSCENVVLQSMDNAEEKKQNEEIVADPASDNIPAAQSTNDAEEKKQKEETAAAKEINTAQGTDDGHNEEITDKEMTINSDKNHVSLKALLSEKGAETKEKKGSTKDRVLSFRRRSSKDNESPAKPCSGQQDWNSPARLPVEKAPKGKKQQWMPFICCPSIN